VKGAIERAGRLLESSAERAAVDELRAELEALPPRELVRFDALSRSWSSGLSSKEIARLRWPQLRGGRKSAWEVLALVSADGRERERGVRATGLTRLTVLLLAIRATDWVGEVRAAALDRLDECDLPLLIEALPLADQLAVERIRGDELQLLLDRRLPEESLRDAACAPRPGVRRAAWRRLVERGATAAGDVAGAVRDQDVVVRMLAASAIDRLAPEEQRRLALSLMDDPVGAVAVPAVNALAALDDVMAVQAALVARSAGARRAARGWAAIRGIDARGLYLKRLEVNRRDAIALTGLSEIGSPDDASIFHEMLDDDRARVRAAGLRGLARIDEATARRIAVDALRSGVSGRMLWAAADILRRRSPSDREIDALVPVALDRQRSAGQRLRAISLLRPSRWVHLSTLLHARALAEDDALRLRLDHEVNAWLARSRHARRGPADGVRHEIERFLVTVDADRRRAIEFVLRTVV
jgi:hypothetical protein